MRVELRARDDTEVEVTDDTWSPQIPQMSVEKGSTHAWTVAGDRTSIPLRLLRIASVAAPRVKIAKAFLHSIVDVTGVVQTAALYRIQGPAPSVVLTLPPHSADAKFSLDGNPLKPERIREARPDSGEYRLDIGGLSPNPERVLAVEYRDPERIALRICGAASSAGPLVSRQHIDRLADLGSYVPLRTVPVSRSLRVLARVSLAAPDGVLEPRAHAAGCRLGRLAGNHRSHRPAMRVIPTHSAGSGTVPTILVGSMAQAFVIFVGAGLSLLAAFVLLKLPVARTPLTLFLFAFAVAVAYLWSAETVRLLLQPAFFGFLLAGVAAALDGRIQRGAAHSCLPRRVRPTSSRRRPLRRRSSAHPSCRF